jgi:hypothetical protein
VDELLISLETDLKYTVRRSFVVKGIGSSAPSPAQEIAVKKLRA